jgi:predicted nucleic acid-binding protein
MIVLDASVIVKWFSEEEYADKALQIRERFLKGEESIIIPDLLLYELANALRYNRDFNSTDVRDALASIFDMDIDIIVPISALISSAITLAFDHNITIYDAFYVALAKESGLSLVTADDKLYKRTRELNLVKFINDI